MSAPTAKPRKVGIGFRLPLLDVGYVRAVAWADARPLPPSHTVSAKPIEAKAAPMGKPTLKLVI
jgi:hypothetical protein